MLSLKTTANIQVVEKKHEEKERTESKIEEEKQKPVPEIRVPTREELEANIKMREKQQEVKEVEKVYHELHKKAIQEQDKK